MCALQFASQVEQKQIDNTINGETIKEKLKNQCAFRINISTIKRSLQKLRYCLHWFTFGKLNTNFE
jgi:hypothetical protein